MPDLPANATTPVTIALGSSYDGDLEVAGDRDWVRINMTNGAAAQVTLSGRGNSSVELGDPYLRIYDRNGVLVVSNDDFNGFDSQASFTATYTGAYYIEAAGYGNQAGLYTITASTPPPPAIQPILWGTALSDTSVNVYFVPNGDTRNVDFTEQYTSEGFNAYERGQIMATLDRIESMTDLEFTIVTDPNFADLSFVLDTNEIGANGFLGLFNPPGETYEGNGFFNGIGQGWDRSSGGGGLEQGGYGYTTIVHEVLHGLGLAHPHDNGGSSTVMTGVGQAFGDYGTSGMNQGIFTTMSYNSGYLTGTAGSAGTSDFSFGYEAGPMALDIAALQALYGTGSGYATGGTTYNLPDANTAGTYWEAIWDTGGRDVISYDGNRNATIDLRMASLLDATGGGGYVSSANGIAGGYTIANGVVIEIARGGFGDDTLIGNGANNVLIGRGGHDTLMGDSGNDVLRGDNGRDVLYGGVGSDTLLGQTGNDTMYGGDNNDFMQGGAGDDVMDGGFGADYMQGGNSRDRMMGGNGADVLLGEQGNDWLQGDQGADQLFGGGGSDMFIFVSASDSLNTTNRRDVISDFTRGQDRIDLSELDAGRTVAGDQAFTFRGTAHLQTGTIGQVRFNDGPGNSVVVAVDVDGDGVGDMHILVEGVSSLNAADFIL